MSKVMDGSLEVSEFELQSNSYDHFWTKNLGMNSIILQDMG